MTERAHSVWNRRERKHHIFRRDLRMSGCASGPKASSASSGSQIGWKLVLSTREETLFLWYVLLEMAGVYRKFIILDSH